MLTFTVEELIRFLSNWTMTFFEGAKRSGDIVFSRYCAPQRKNTAPRKMNSCQVVRVA